MSLRPVKRAPVKQVDHLVLTAGSGISGDHYSGKSKKRQVTLMQKDYLDQVSQKMGFEVDMTMTRRNILVSDINLTELIGRKFRLGTAVLEATGHCKPCEQMDKTIGPGGWKAMKGLAGITARVIEGGQVKQEDKLEPI